MMMEPNRVPAEPIVAIVKDYLQQDGDRTHEGSFESSSIYLLAERVDVKGDTLQSILSGRAKTIDFDLADRLLCVTNMSSLWLTDLSDIYLQAQLPEGEKKHVVATASGKRVCARRGCSVVFVPSVKKPDQKFCSPGCRSTAWKHKKGLKTGQVRGKGRVLESLVCRNGHPRTKENTTEKRAGVSYCRICKNETAKRYRDRRRARLDA